jgi:3,4-dihydroxy-2-butanone 4-phosphate synthase
MRNGESPRDENGIRLGASVCIRVPQSHRKRQQFIRLLGRTPEWLYSFRFPGHFTYLTSEEYDRVKPSGATRARVDGSKLMKCWNG